MRVALRGLWGGELGDLLVEQVGQRRCEQQRLAIEGEVGSASWWDWSVVSSTIQ